MTEREWRGCVDPIALLAYLNRPQGDRKLLLYAVACCRAHQHLLPDVVSRDAIEWAELYADRKAQRDEEYDRLEWASEGAAFRCEASLAREHVANWVSEGADESDASLRQLHGRIEGRTPLSVHAAYFANELMTLDSHSPFDPALTNRWLLLLVAPLRDIFGNPFRSVIFSPDWRTDTAVSLARTMYEERDFSAMPILADAIQDAGCNNTDVLEHCRGPGEHVRGCWVVDRVLRNE